MLCLYLLRHVESQANACANIVGGRLSDSTPTEKGRNQAIALADRLANENVHFDEVISSPAVRAAETARTVCQHIGFPLDNIIYSDRVHEMSCGDWEGKPQSQIYTPELIRTLESNRWEFCPPNGESRRDVTERMYSVVGEFAAKSASDLTVAIFGHKMAFKCLLRHIVGATVSPFFNISLDNASITQLEYDSNLWRIVRVNDTAHLMQTNKRLI